MSFNNYSIPSHGDSQLLPNWFAPFSVTVGGGDKDVLIDMESPYWGAVNAIDRTYGAGTDIADGSPFVNEDGSEFGSTEATITKLGTANASYLGTDQYQVAYKAKAFSDNGGNIYSTDITFKNLGGRRAFVDSLFIKFSLQRAAATGTLTLGVRLIGTDDYGTEQSNIVISDGLTFSSNVASVDTRVDGVDLDLNYRIVLEYAYEPSASETGPNITLQVPGLQAVAFLDNDQTTIPGTLGTTTVLGAYRNPTGTVTEWEGTPWKSRSIVALRPNFVSRIQFTSVTGNGTPGVSFSDAEYVGNSNVVPIAKDTGTVFAGGDISLYRISKRRFVLRNTHATSGNTVVFSGVIVGVLVR